MASNKITLTAEQSKSVKIFQDEIAQINHELALVAQLPELLRLKRGLEARMALAARCLAAAQLGFSPFTPNSDWVVGYLAKPKLDPAYLPFRLYNRPIPQPAIDGYKAAQTSGIFDLFTVHSPDWLSFDEIIPPPPRSVDPVLVGWINAKAASLENPISKDKRLPAYCFLIHAWDLELDLRAAGLIE